MPETVTTGGSSRDERPSLAKAFDWGARRTWLVFLGLAVGHGFVAGALDPLAQILPLYVFRLVDLEIVGLVTTLAMLALMLGWWVLLNRFCRSLHLPEAMSGSPEAVAALRPWRRSWFGWLLVVVWILLAFAVSYGVEFVFLPLIHGTSDGWDTPGILMALVVYMGVTTLPGFMDRWGRKKVARDA